MSGFTGLHDAKPAGFVAMTLRFEALEARFHFVDKRIDALAAD